MTVKQLLINLAKLVLCGLAWFAGMIVGGMIARGLQLTVPAMPEGTDANTVLLYFLLTSPILALALAILARGLTGGFLTRALVLSFLMWIAYMVNNQLDAWLYMPGSVGLAYMSVDSLVSSLLCGATVAWLFPPDSKGREVGAALKTFFGTRRAGEWAWRLALAAVAFMPIYYFFGLFAIQFTGAYYQQNMYGLRLVGLDLILPIQFLRSLLFLLACLPFLALWRASTRSLFVRLGLALFILVGLQTAIAYWMPLTVRVPHSLEILADEFVYAGVLIALLVRSAASAEPHQTVARQTAAG